MNQLATLSGSMGRVNLVENSPEITQLPTLQKKGWNPRTRMQTRSKNYICPNDTLVGHSSGTLFWDTLVGHSYTTLLWVTLVGSSCGILLIPQINPCGTLRQDTGGSLLWDTLVGHSCGTLL